MSGAKPKGARVIVIGAGVTGLSSAWWLARSGVDVLVLDKGVVGWEASSRNGGGASHYHSPLFHEEQRLWPQMDELLGYATEYRRERVIFAVTEHHLANYRRMAEICRGLGYRVDDLDPRQVRETVPLAGDNVTGGIHLRAFGGEANPQRTVQAYAWALQDLGGRVLQHTPALALREAGGRITGVQTPEGLFECDHLVVAAGPQAEALLAPIGVKLPLAPARAEMIVTEPAPLMPFGGVDGHGLYGRQTRRGNLAYGGGPHEWLEEVDPLGPRRRASTPVMQSLARRVAELLPKAASLRVIRSWAGIVETTPDGRPVLDRVSDGLTVATMSGVGFGLSPATGHAVRDLVIDGRCAFADLSKLRLGRFADTPVDWRDRQGWVPVSHAQALGLA
jgi:sarcosine oxidase subunit beta